MKKLIFIAALVFIWAISEAEAFVPRIHISFHQTVATATVVNNFHRPIVCSGFAYGQTSYGHVFNSWVNNMVIFPGGYANAYVYTQWNNPFINAWSNIQCNWYY